ncbi:MAG TPA: UDP-N-acetylglucosamine 2-epimerase [Tepidisphaeraceae bacterium]
MRNICFVTGTRAEFGLMQSVLRAIRKHKKLHLQLIATGMHLDPAHGAGVQSIEREGWKVDRVVGWGSDSGRDRATTARNTGLAMTGLVDAFVALQTDLVLVVGDRVEAFAAASAAHIAGLPVAHVHGGDRALGQVDDALRHAITKLAHIHFPATRQSAQRIYQLGEERWRITRAGSPGLDGITKAAASPGAIRKVVGRVTPGRFALIVLHPAMDSEQLEYTRAGLILNATRAIPFEQILIVYPNNDPGAAGIMRCWEAEAQADPTRVRAYRDLPRRIFLGLLRDAAVLIGNSSSGIIEAASFGTPVIDIGPRQQGRERGRNVLWAPYASGRLGMALRSMWNNGRPRHFASQNIYGGEGAGRIIADTLAKIEIDLRLTRKLIRY